MFVFHLIHIVSFPLIIIITFSVPHLLVMLTLTVLIIIHYSFYAGATSLASQTLVIGGASYSEGLACETRCNRISLLCLHYQVTKLVFNCMKSVVVAFRKSCSVFSCNFQYNISGNTLDTIPLQKDLGVYISHDLSWSDHCYKIVFCAMKQLYLIRYSFHTNSTSAKKDIVHFTCMITTPILFSVMETKAG